MKNAKNKTSSIIHHDSFAIVAGMDEKTTKKFCIGLLGLMYDTEYIDDDPVVNLILHSFKKQFERDKIAYDLRCKANRENGAKGGRPKKNPENPMGSLGPEHNPENPMGSFATEHNPTEPKKADKDSDSDLKANQPEEYLDYTELNTSNTRVETNPFD